MIIWLPLWNLEISFSLAPSSLGRILFTRTKKRFDSFVIEQTYALGMHVVKQLPQLLPAFFIEHSLNCLRRLAEILWRRPFAERVPEDLVFAADFFVAQVFCFFLWLDDYCFVDNRFLLLPPPIHTQQI
jgi:hypothetical protein